MKQWMIFGTFTLMVLAYIFWPDQKDSFDQFRSRKPAHKVTEQTSKPMNRAELALEQEVKIKRDYQTQLKPLDSRSVAATSIKEAVEDQVVEADPILIRDSRYLVSKNVYAVKKSDWRDNDPAIIKSFAGHYLIRSETPISEALPVLINSETSRYAIVTKVLKVKLKDMESRNNLFEFPYQVVEVFEHINVVMYKFEDLETLVEANSIARENDQVKRSNIEILENMRTGR